MQKTTSINNRRYLGNKYKLLPFITSVVEANCANIDSVADVFAGTGAVASAFTSKRLLTNDNLYSNYICHVAWFSPMDYSQKKVEDLICLYNKTEGTPDNYMSKNFGDTFFSVGDCRKIGFIREDIEERFLQKEINEKERALLVTSLLYACDKIANTCGHYDAFRQGVEFIKELELFVPAPESKLSKDNVCYNEDTNELVRRIFADLIYIDPPYNSRQYCDAYHLLENIARWEKPEVSGVARKMDRQNLKSDYSTNKATAAFEDLIGNIDARYILLSYNNMSEKGNSRSNAKLSDEDILKILRSKGKVNIFSQKYKPFTAGKSDIVKHEERLFLCEVKPRPKFVKSPLNYTGGKHKILDQILPHFPNKIDAFVDLFSGGCNVGVNVNAKKVFLNDSNTKLQDLFATFNEVGYETVLAEIDNTISKYGLSRSSEKGYGFYGCNSSSGLGSFNKDSFLRLREDYNLNNSDIPLEIMLYVLVVFAFNNQIRFNSNGDFNLPVGKRDFNGKMKEKLIDFINQLQSGKYVFSNCDFRSFNFSRLTQDSLVYCDPPYLITCATYNEQNGWNEKSEKDLLDLLDILDAKNIKFALSNVLTSKGRTNKILADWIAKRSYKVLHMNHSYKNSNYHKKDKTSPAQEVLIINY